MIAPIRLMEARASAGLKDIDVRDYLAASDFKGAADIVIRMVEESVVSTSFSSKNANQPEVFTLENDGPC